MLKRIIKTKRLYLIAFVAVVVLLWIFLGGDEATPSFETTEVKRGDVSRVVSETGIVLAADDVNLTFTSSGRISSVLVKRGQKVSLGQTLVQLESAQAEAQLSQAQAALRAIETRAGSGGGDQAVKSAYRKLLSTGLTAVQSENASSDPTPPEVTGLYDGDEGMYELQIKFSPAAGNRYQFELFGLERLGPVTILQNEPTPLGSHGLFISFPEDLSVYVGSTWYVTIPNTSSASYLANYNAYQEALNNSSALLADVDQARAAVRAAEASLAQTRLVAPFDGFVTALSVTPGQIASPGASVLTLVSDDKYEIRIEIPEDDIEGVEVGDRAEITFDALRDVRMEAEVIYVAPAASIVSGATIFEVVLQFIEEDSRLRSGLTADVDIFAESRVNVISVPVRAVVEEGGERFVRVLMKENTYKRVPVSAGLRGDGMYEITSGLEEGQTVITFANSTALSSLIEVTE